MTKFLTVVVAVIVVALAGCGVTKPTSAPVPSATSTRGSVGSVGQPVRDGNLEFTVTNTKVGTDWFANGMPGSGNVYFVASVTVKDTGTLSESVSPVDQVAVVGTNQYNGFAFAVSSDSSGSGKGELDSATLVLAPGATTSLQIPWVVPVGTKVSYLILHTSGSSSGARINID